jgi:hypothetical protein
LAADSFWLELKRREAQFQNRSWHGPEIIPKLSPMQFDDNASHKPISSSSMIGNIFSKRNFWIVIGVSRRRP